MTASEIGRVLGAGHRSGQWWRCRCPVHGSAGATLAVRNGERGIIVHCHAGCDPREVLAELRRLGLIAGGVEHCGAPAPVGTDRSDNTARRMAAARRLWEAGQDARGSPVERYLRSRGIETPPPPCLRWAPACWHPSGRVLPAMLARIDDINGELVGVHRTFLKPDGSGKATVEPAKAMLGRAACGAVRLAPNRPADWLAVGEGLETCGAVMQATAMPVWAALSTSGMTALVLPRIVRQVVILADHDANGAGERAARADAQRWLSEGRRVRIAMPPEPGTDFSDVLLGQTDARIAEVRDVAA